MSSSTQGSGRTLRSFDSVSSLLSCEWHPSRSPTPADQYPFSVKKECLHYHQTSSIMLTSAANVSNVVALLLPFPSHPLHTIPTTWSWELSAPEKGVRHHLPASLHKYACAHRAHCKQQPQKRHRTECFLFCSPPREYAEDRYRKVSDWPLCHEPCC